MLNRIRYSVRLDVARRIIAKRTICLVKGHLSTGRMLWWMCDRCYTDFRAIALPSVRTLKGKITKSPAFR